MTRVKGRRINPVQIVGGIYHVAGRLCYTSAMGMNGQFLWMILEAFSLGLFLYFLVKLRPVLGIVPLVVSVGTLQFLQVVLALGMYVEVLPGLVVSPGSVVLFPGTVLGVLLIYIVDDATGARKLIYGLLLANLMLSLLTLALSVHSSGPAARPLLELPSEIFLQNPRMMIVGTFALFVDTVLVILIFEATTPMRWLMARVYISLCGVLIIDSLIFSVGAFAENDGFWSILSSGILGKVLFALPFAMAVGVGQRFFRAEVRQSKKIRDVFHMLTYRERYEVAMDEARHDALSGLRNRRAFDEDAAKLGQAPYALLILDIDSFKSVNDELGHQVGDTVLTSLGNELGTLLRDDDQAYRYGGEEFVIVLSGADSAVALRVAERIRSRVAERFIREPLSDARPVTITVGVGVSPTDGTTSKAVLSVADQRLYDGKRAGRNCVVGPKDAAD